MMDQNSLKLRSLYLSSIGIIFLIAFISYYIQFPGLNSSAGLEPAHRIFPYSHPALHKYLIQSELVDTDSLCDFLALFGAFFASLAVCGVHHGVIYLLLTAIYGILATLGQVFYSFQWDILLLETGAATGICLAPWISLRSTVTDHGIGSWPLRFLLFKLMFMSGAVKIQADCPTWRNLTALEYHFATQCLPGPLAWHAHQLPPFLLRASVAATFFIEIPAAFLLIAPSVAIRSVGAQLQILLQVMIMLTGNYNFFNILTIVLCIPCIEDDYWFQSKKTIGRVRSFSKVQVALTLTALSYCFLKMFHIQQVNSWKHMSISLHFFKTECEMIIEKYIPATILCTFIFLTMSLIAALYHNQSSIITSIQLFFRGAMCILWLGVLAVPLLSLTPALQRTGFVGSKDFIQLYQSLLPYHVSNGYGLFRRMTGVGSFRDQSSTTISEKQDWGWAGLPPSVVARPEVILEGIFENDDNDWKELAFLWKPGNVTSRPRQMAPYQPRLDWQMWFAALGRYNHNPWLVHLTYKLLDGCEPVLDLVDEQLKLKKHTISKIRATLWNYDFTRLDTEWNRKIPGVSILRNDATVEKLELTSSSRPSNTTRKWKKALMGWPKQYWSREFVRGYLPPLGRNDESLKGFLTANGYLPPDQKSTCIFGIERCKSYDEKSNAHLLCSLSTSIREKNLLWVISFVTLTCGVFWNILTNWKVRKQVKVRQNKLIKND